MVSELTKLIVHDQSPDPEQPQVKSKEELGKNNNRPERDKTTCAQLKSGGEQCQGVEKLAAIPSGIAHEDVNIKSAGSESPTRGEGLQRQQSPSSHGSSLAWLSERRGGLTTPCSIVGRKEWKPWPMNLEKLFSVKEAPGNYADIETSSSAAPLEDSGNEERYQQGSSIADGCEDTEGHDKAMQSSPHDGLQDSWKDESGSQYIYNGERVVRPAEVFGAQEHEVPDNRVNESRFNEPVYSREPKPAEPAQSREEETVEKLIYEARRLHETEDGVEKEIRKEQLVEMLMEEARRLRSGSMIPRGASDQQRRPSPLSNAVSDFHSASGRSSNTQNVEMQELVDNESLPSRVPNNKSRSTPGGKMSNRHISEGTGWQYDQRQYSRRRGPIRNTPNRDRISDTQSLDNLYRRAIIDPDILKRSSIEMILTEAALFRERLREQEYENERWERFSGVTEPILRRTRRGGSRHRSYKESSVGLLPDEVQPLIPSQAGSIGNGNELEMEHSPWIRAMQPASSRSEQVGRACRDEMDNSVGTCSTPRMLQHEIDIEGKRTLEMYQQQQSEEREWDETDRLMEDDIVYQQEQRHGDLVRVCNPRIKIPFILGDKVIFKVDLSDCEVKKGDCGEVVALMEMGSVVVRTNNLAIEVKVDNIYLKKADVYEVKFVTGLCGFGVVPGSRSKSAYVGPTLQSEHARRTVLSGSQIVKVNNQNVEVGYCSREIKEMIKTSKRPIAITFKWDQERADKMLSQRAPY